MIKIFPELDAYAAAGLPTLETRVANITEGNLVKVDGVNVVKKTARFGDPIFKDANGNLYIVDRETFNNTLIPAGWTYQGPFLYQYDADTLAYWKGNYASLPTKKFLDACQYAITAISSTSLTINLSMAPSYSQVAVAITLTAATIDATSAAEISAAVAAAATAAGDTRAWWAYLADADGNKVDSDGTQIIVQCDTCTDYRFYNVSGTGCTITHISWRDMPASDNYFKVNGQTTNTRGLENIARGKAYWSTNGRELTENVAVGSEAGGTNPMKESEFLTSQYAAAVRAHYGTYENYLKGEFGIMWPQTKGVFGLPDGKYLTEKYGPIMVPTKDGGTKAQYPALNWAYLEGGHLWDVNESVIFMEDSRMTILNDVQTKVGKVTISNGTYRWCAQRCIVNYAWIFNGPNGTLNSHSVNLSYQVGCVALLSTK